MVSVLLFKTNPTLLGAECKLPALKPEGKDRCNADHGVELEYILQSHFLAVKVFKKSTN